MKNETAKREIESLDYYLQNHTDDYSEESHTAMMMAIKALEQEPCDNAVSRQAVLKTLNDMDNILDEDRTIENYKELLKECYEVLPPVTPQPKTGHWIRISPAEIYECSECGQNVMTSDICAYRFCHGCGAKMVEPQESEDKECE